MNTVGVLLKDTQISQLNYEVIRELNLLNQEVYNTSFSIFYLNSTPVCVNNYCSLQTIHDLHKVKEGIIIATDLDTALILEKSQTMARKVYYVYSLEFLYYQTNYLENYRIFNKLDLWSRSENYRKVIGNYCNKDVKISNNIKGIINAY